MMENSIINSQFPARAQQSCRPPGNSAAYQQRGQLQKADSSFIMTDRVSLSSSTESIGTYDSSMALHGGQNDGYDLLRGLVLNLFQEQGIDFDIATNAGKIDLTTLTPEEAQELIAEDGYFGVEQTSQRIFELAVAIAGGDPTRLDAIKAGVDRGFQEASDAFDGLLPDISYATYDAVMTKLNDWAGEGAKAASLES